MPPRLTNVIIDLVVNCTTLNDLNVVSYLLLYVVLFWKYLVCSVKDSGLVLTKLQFVHFSCLTM